MKRTTTALAALCVGGALALAGCSSAGTGSQSEEQSADASGDSGGVCDVVVDEAAQSAALAQSGEESVEESEAAVDTVTLSDDALAAPTASFTAPLDITTEVVKVTNEGDGATIEEGQLITLNYMVCDIVTGEKMYSTWGATSDADTPADFILSTTNFGEALTTALSGEKVGTRLLWGEPGYSAEESYTGTASNGYLYVMSITDTKEIPESASGTEVTPEDENLPQVTIEDDKPAITIPSTFTDPTELIVEPLIEGDGETVEPGQTVIVKYTGWLTDGTQFDSSWDREGADATFAFPVGQGSVIEGWDQGLIGQKVGSRVLMVIPSDLAYGETGSRDTIPANSTLVFVVDILAAY